METEIIINENLPVIGGGKKSDIVAAAKNMAEAAVEHGLVLHLAERMAASELLVKELRKNEAFVQATISEVAKHPGGYKSPSGAKIENTEAGTTYDYSADKEWAFLKELADLAANRVKEREEYLRKFPNGQWITDGETGELLGVGPLKKSTSTFRTTLAK